MKLREHEWSGPGGRVCRICGGYKKPDGSVDDNLRCLEREIAAVAETAPRIIACEDAETIGARLAELAAERTVAWNAVASEAANGDPAAGPAIDPNDCCF